MAVLQKSSVCQAVKGLSQVPLFGPMAAKKAAPIPAIRSIDTSREMIMKFAKGFCCGLNLSRGQGKEQDNFLRLEATAT